MSIVIEGKAVAGEHDGCNLKGSDTLTLTATYDADVVSVSYANDDSTFGSCDDELTAIVAPVGVGETTVTRCRRPPYLCTGGNGGQASFRAIW